MAELDSILKDPEDRPCYIYVNQSKHYKDITYNNFYLFFSPCDKWNDLCDIDLTKNKETDQNLYYLYRCTSYFKSESIAMWKMYAEKGFCFRLSKAPIQNLNKFISKIELCFKRKDSIEIDMKDINRVSTAYVIYFNQQDDGNYVLLRSRKKAVIDKDVFNEIKNNRYLKNTGWSYEYECRLCLTIPKYLIKNKKSFIGAKVYLNDKGKNKITCIRSPFDNKNKLNIKGFEIHDSEFCGKINMK